MSIKAATIVGFVVAAIAEMIWIDIAYKFNFISCAILMGCVGLFGAGTVALYVWLYHAYTAKWWRWLALPIGLAAVLVSFVSFRTVRYEEYRFRISPTNVIPKPFESEGWFSGSATLRHAMADHLMESQELIGRSRAELEQKLGPLTVAEPAEVLGWFLGERQSGSDWFWDYQEFLCVEFNKQGVSERVYVFDAKD